MELKFFNLEHFNWKLLGGEKKIHHRKKSKPFIFTVKNIIRHQNVVLWKWFAVNLCVRTCISTSEIWKNSKYVRITSLKFSGYCSRAAATSRQLHTVTHDIQHFNTLRTPCDARHTAYPGLTSTHNCAITTHHNTQHDSTQHQIIS